jgi:peptidase A4-like protein
MRKFGRAAATAAGAASLAGLASLLSITVPASAYTTGPVAPAAPAATRAGTLARIKPGGPMSLPRNQPPAPPAFSGKTINVVSQNWGGYVAQQQGVRFRYVRAAFFVPYVDCASTPSSFSGHWVGLDGAGNGTVEQDGILAACQGTTPVYSAWYEMFPLPPVYSSITVRPGNSIVASAYYNSGTGKFTLSLTNTTNGEHFTHALACPSGSLCPRSSAEVISEAPSSGTAILPLTNFRAESFTDVVVTNSHGHRGGLRAPWWDTFGVSTENNSGTVLDQPTQVFRAKAFDCYWMAQG